MGWYFCHLYVFRMMDPNSIDKNCMIEIGPRGSDYQIGAINDTTAEISSYFKVTKYLSYGLYFFQYNNNMITSGMKTKFHNLIYLMPNMNTILEMVWFDFIIFMNYNF